VSHRVHKTGFPGRGAGGASTGYPGVPAITNVDIAVDGTNTTDAYPIISNALQSGPDGTAGNWRRYRLVPTGGSVVRMTAAAQVSTKSYFILDLNGCELRIDSAAVFDQLHGGVLFGHGYLGFWDGGVHHAILTNGTLTGNNPSPGVYSAAREAQANVEIAGGGTTTPCHDIKIYNLTMKNAGGDNLKVGGSGDVAYNIDGYNNNCLNAGRNGYSVIFGHDLTWGTLGANTHGPCGYNCTDVEPNASSNPCSNVFMDNNSWTSFSNAFFSLNGTSTVSAFDNIKLRNNTISGNHLYCVANNAASRPTNIEITGNRSTAAAVAGPAFIFAHIDGLKYLSPANTQPLSSGALASVTDCTAVS
jgi:hypothetical protein